MRALPTGRDVKFSVLEYGIDPKDNTLRCDSNYDVATEEGEDYDCKQNLWSGCYFIWSRPVSKSTSDTIAQTISAQADRVDLLLSRDSAG